jgi:hypothetical protein
LNPATWGSITRLPEPLKAGLIIAVIVLATRAWLFGNPVIGIDEQFYLLVGDRMREGALPYVDIWDRKPIGLFLIYAAGSALFSDPVIGPQVLASLCAALTGWLIFACARRHASFAASLGAGAAYAAWLPVFAGVGGQSPVFYNLPMMLGAALLLGLLEPGGPQRIFARGCAVMLLSGIALQIKYSAVFDGIFFGLSLLWLGWRSGWGMPRLAAAMLGWTACALLPTATAFAAYAALRHGREFIQANFLSIFGDVNSPLNAVLRLAALTFGLSPFLVCLWIVWQRRRAIVLAERWILIWFAASYAGFLAFGVYYDHYMLPLLLPLCLIAAMAFTRLARQQLAIALVAGLGLLGGTGRAIADRLNAGSGAEARALAAKIMPHLKGGCLYVNEEAPILYWLTRSCLPTRYAFPEHLVLYRYEHALGVDQRQELEATFARRPTVVVKSTTPDDDTRAASRALLESHLRRDYRMLGQGKIGAVRYEIHALVRK